MCQLVPVSRRSFYRSLQEQRPAEEETEVRSVIQQIALEHRRRYGYRRITAELRRRGMQVNHKRVVRIMQEDNLLALQPKRFKVTTNSNHKFEVYLNLAARMKLTGINQLWVADITYIRLKAEFVYLAVILDGYSRKVVGWALDHTLAMRLTVGALEQAIERRQPQPGLVHHSDRGLQYARAEYIRGLRAACGCIRLNACGETGRCPCQWPHRDYGRRSGRPCRSAEMTGRRRGPVRRVFERRSGCACRAFPR